MKFFKISLKIFKVKNFPKIVPYLSTSLALLFLTSVLFINFEVIQLPEALAQTAGNKWVFERTSDADKLKLYYNTTATTAMTVTTGGNVGIGTSAPLSRLHIVGNLELGTAAGGAGNDKFFFAGSTNTNYFMQYDTAASGLKFVVNNNNMIMNSSGNIGVGITAPVGKMNVVSTTSGNRTNLAGYTLAGNFQTNGVGGPAAGLFASSYTSGSTNSMGVYGDSLVWNNYSDSFGGYFYGTNAAGGGAVTQNVYGVYGYGYRNAGGSGHSYGVYANAVGAGGGAYGVFTTASGGSGSYGLYSAGGLNYFQGNIGLRVASPAQDLHIKQQSNSQSNGGIRLERADATNFATIIIGGDNQLYLFANSNNQYCIVSSSNSIPCPSDRRLKENIAPLGGSAIDILTKLRPSTFNWKSNGETSVGFIAQEVKEVLPNAVNYSEVTGYYNLADSYFTPYLVKGTQELAGKVKSLEDNRPQRKTYNYSELGSCAQEPVSFTEYKACMKEFDQNCQSEAYKGGTISNINGNNIEGICYK